MAVSSDCRVRRAEGVEAPKALSPISHKGVWDHARRKGVGAVRRENMEPGQKDQGLALAAWSTEADQGRNLAVRSIPVAPARGLGALAPEAAEPSQVAAQVIARTLAAVARTVPVQAKGAAAGAAGQAVMANEGNPGPR
jgi:hypothetical protein